MSAAAPSSRRIHRRSGPLDEPELQAAASLLLELRSTLTEESARAFLRAAPATGYELGLLVEHDGAEPTAMAGFRIMTTSRGRILMLEDLVVSAPGRSTGAGSALLVWLATVARSEGCSRIELDTGVTNTAAQAFYMRHGMRGNAVHFSFDLD